MTNANTNLRKAALLLRSLDADTAATMLAQLSTVEAATIRKAIRELGHVDPDEQAEVLADFRNARPHAVKSVEGVELALSSSFSQERPNKNMPSRNSMSRFEFLRDAPVKALVTYLSREHAQTIAVIISHLAPVRAGEVLSALPAKLQADTVERLSGLGEMDPASVTALEQELSTWLAKRGVSRADKSQNGDAVTSILAAADAKTRDGIISNLQSQKSVLADRIAAVRDRSPKQYAAATREDRQATRNAKEEMIAPSQPFPIRPKPQTIPAIDFDHLAHLDNRALASVLREVDANVLALALVGSRDELVDRICDQMPKRIARAFRRELRRIGPTRLSDVEAAQRAVAAFAAQHLARRRRTPIAASC